MSLNPCESNRLTSLGDFISNGAVADNTSLAGFVVHDDELREAAAFLAVRDLIRVQGGGDTLTPVASV